MGLETFDILITSLAVLLEPARLAILASGVVIGLGIGIIPGLGGVVGMALLLPFTLNMDPPSAFAFLLGMGSVTTTSDTIPTVLFGVPGTTGSAATVLDGHPLAKKGQAGRALGAAYMASLLGGLTGALFLGVSIPFMRPVVLYMGSPELLAICVFGMSMVIALSGNSPLKGLVAGGIGLTLSMVGPDPTTGINRFTFDTLYLWDGFPLIPIIFGLFAVPEMGTLAGNCLSGKVTRERESSENGAGTGVRDTLHHWWLVLRCSWIGAALGAIPGIGSAVIDWVAYGHALKTEKNTEQFGQGDIRGVIASESANNAKEGGALIPTLAFGVPGSAQMAILLGAFTMHGLVPGPAMLTKHLDVTYTMMWSVALANVLGAGLCILFSNRLARIINVRPGILLPIILSVVFLGAFQGSRQWGDFYTFLAIGFLSMAMKRLGWPRVPVILGFVLGELMERYLFISVNRYEYSWMVKPVVLLFFILSIISLGRPLWQSYKKHREKQHRIAFGKPVISISHLFTGAIITFFTWTLVVSASWTLAARILPQVVAVISLISAFGVLFGDLFIVSMNKHKTSEPYTAVERPDRLFAPQTVPYIVILISFPVLSLFMGILPATFAFIFLVCLLWGKETLRMSILTSAGVGVVIWILFDRLLAVPWPRSFIEKLFF